jgi:hypothetical protein
MQLVEYQVCLHFPTVEDYLAAASPSPGGEAIERCMYPLLKIRGLMPRLRHALARGGHSPG